MMAAAFPDFRMNVEDMIVEGDRGVVRAKLTGTHQGEFMGIPATGRSINLTVIDIVRVSDGKAAEHWGAMDSGAMMEQLGAAPPA
jgi:predicted ester cyclase